MVIRVRCWWGGGRLIRYVICFQGAGVELRGVVTFMGVIGITGVLAVSLAFILTMDTCLVGLFGIFDFVLLLIGQPGQFAGVAGGFVSLSIVLFCGFLGGYLRLEDRADNVGRNTAHICNPVNSVIKSGGSSLADIFIVQTGLKAVV